MEASYQPDKLLHEGVAVVGGVRAAVAVEYGKVQQVVMDTGNTEAILVLLPEAQDGRTADPGQTDLRGRRESVLHFIHSFIFSFNPRFFSRSSMQELSHSFTNLSTRSSSHFSNTTAIRPSIY